MPIHVYICFAGHTSGSIPLLPALHAYGVCPHNELCLDDFPPDWYTPGYGALVAISHGLENYMAGRLSIITQGHSKFAASTPNFHVSMLEARKGIDCEHLLAALPWAAARMLRSAFPSTKGSARPRRSVIHTKAVQACTTAVGRCSCYIRGTPYRHTRVSTSVDRSDHLGLGVCPEALSPWDSSEPQDERHRHRGEPGHLAIRTLSGQRQLVHVFKSVPSLLSQYDLSVSTFSPDGRVFQTEYAQKAVDSSG